MYFVNKIVTWCLSPMGILFLGLLAGGALSRANRAAWRRTGRWVIGLTLALVWTLGCGVTTRLIGLPLEGEEMAEVKVPQGEKYDAIVLLGGGMGAHAKCGRAEMFGGADRVWTAARLWKSCRDANLKIVLTSLDVEKSTVPLLKDFGVDEKVLVCFPEARNTEEEANLIAKAGIRRILLVTSAWHMPRAKMLFGRKGFDVTPVPTDYEMHYGAEAPLEIRDFFPSAEALVRNSAAVKEWVARAGYGVVRR